MVVKVEKSNSNYIKKRPPRNYIKFIKNIDSIIDVLVQKFIIKIPSIKKHHFPKGVPK